LRWLKYELKDVIITSIQHADLDGDGLPEEELQLDFGGLKLTYVQYDASGKPAGQTSAEWNDGPVIR